MFKLSEIGETQEFFTDLVVGSAAQIFDPLNVLKDDEGAVFVEQT